MNDPLKPWERPWTVQEMRDHAANWSLAGDAGLLQHLTQLSQHFVEQMQSTSNCVDSLFADLEHAQCNLINVRSNFSALAHSQFVENRVAEEDEHEESPAENCKDADTDSTEVQMRTVLQNSLIFLDEMFEPMELPAGSDSDDEDCSPGGRRVILKPINPYANRPLPHIIGSKEFNEDDTVGLVFTPSDEEDSPAATPQQPRQMYGSSSGSDLGLPSEEEDDDMFSPPRPDLPNQPLSFADELASKLGAAIGSPTTLPAVQADSTTTFPPLEQQEPPGLFEDEEDEAEDTIFGPSHGPFSSGKGLFDDLVSTAKEAEATPVEKSKALGGLFVDDDEGLFSAPPVQTPRVSKNSVLLFSDEDDLFAVPPMPREKSNDLFDEPPASPKQTVEYMPKPTPHTTTSAIKQVEKEVIVKKLPAGAVSIFGGQQVFPTSSLRRTSTSSEESTNQHIVTTQTTEPTKMQPKIASDKPVSIFDETESDDELFAENNAKTNQRPQHVSLFEDSDEDVPPQAKTNLFVDSVATTQAVPRTSNKVSAPTRKSSLSTDKDSSNKMSPSKKLTSSLFNESDSDEDLLFSSASSGGSSKLIEPAKVATRHALFDEPSSLFDDEHDLFRPNKSLQSNLFPTEDSNTVDVAKSGAIAKPSLLLGTAEVTQDDLFSEAKPKIPSLQKLPNVSPTKPSLSLNTAEVTQDDLFSEAKPNIPSAQKLPNVSPAKPSLPLDSAEVAQDDLFNETKPKIPSAQKSSLFPSVLPTKPNLPLDTAEVTQDDLFSEAKPNIPSAQKLPNVLPTKPSLPEVAQDDLFSETKPKIPSAQKSSLFPSVLPTKPNLPLDTAEVAQDDLFSEAKPNIPSAQKLPNVLPTKTSLPEVSEDDLFNETKPKIPSAQKSSQLPSMSPAKPSLFLDTAEVAQDDLFNETKPKIPTALKSSQLPIVLPTKPSLSEVAQDDLFSEAKPNIPSAQKLPNASPAKPSLPLDSAEVAQDDLFSEAKPNIPSAQKSSQLDIFSDDDLFDSSVSSKNVKEHESGTLIFSTEGTVKPELPPKVKMPGKSSQPGAPSQSKDILDAKSMTERKPDVETKTKKQGDNALKDGACLIPPNTLGVTSVLFTDDPTSTSLHPPDVGNIAKISPVKRGRELGINPLALLPGKKPVQPGSSQIVSQETKSVESPTPTEEEAISFDSPTLATTLHCPGKDRIRIQQRRKPSTRRGRHGQPASNKTTTAPSFIAPPLLNREPPPLPPSNPISPSTDEDDMFDVPSEQAADDDALFYSVVKSRQMLPDLFADTQDRKTSPENHDNKPSLISKAEDLHSSESQDLFQTDSNSQTNKDSNESASDYLFFIPPASNSSLADDLFSSANDSVKSRKSAENVRSNTPNDLFLPSPNTEKSENVSANIIPPVDDLFGDLPTRPNVLDISNQQTVLQQATAKDDLFSDDALFSPQTLAANTSTASLPHKSGTKNDIFADTDDNDDKDIFTSWVSTKASKPVKPTANMDLFGDGSEDDDLFSPSVGKSSRPTTKPEKSKAKTSTTVISSEQDEFQDPLTSFQSK